MKKVLFIGNRLNALKHIGDFSQLQLLKVYVLEDSLLHMKLSEMQLPSSVEVRLFAIKDKASVFQEIVDCNFDILVSNGCPFILPVSKMKKPEQIFVNIHPTLLPDLKGKTPLSGVFMTHRDAIGATMHYIDEGIDTGKIIAQERIPVTPDLDQGLVYFLSFDLESKAFTQGMQRLLDADFNFEGETQSGEGSYFNRTDEMQHIDISTENTSMVMDKIRSFGVRSQGSILNAHKAVYKIYGAEQILSNYLLQKFDDSKPGEVVFAYDGRLIMRTIDGLIKLTDYKVIDEDKEK